MEQKLRMLTTQAYAAALDDSKWSDFLNACSDHLGGGIRTCITGYDLDAPINLGARQFGYDPDFEKSYTDYYSARDFLACKLMSVGHGQILAYDDIWSDGTLRASEFYNEWVRPQEDITAGCAVSLFNQKRRLFAFSGSIRSKDAEKLDRPWRQLVEYLSPHLQQAFNIARTLATNGIEKQALVNVNDPNAAGFLVVTQSGRITFTSSYAEKLLEMGDVVQCRAGRRIHFANLKLKQTFHVALNDQSSAHSIDLTSSTSGLSLMCRIAPLFMDGLEYQPSGICFGNGEQSYLITLSHQPVSSDLTMRLMSQFKLTQNEAQVAMRIADGNSTREIAELRGTSVSTVRNQIQSVMEKMCARRQSEIVAKILGFGR